MSLSKVLKIAAIGVGSGLVPGLGTAAGAAIAAALAGTASQLEADPDDKQEKEWVDFAKRLAKDEDLDNEDRFSALAIKIRADLIRAGKEPKDHEVNAYAELAVLVAKL